MQNDFEEQELFQDNTGPAIGVILKRLMRERGLTEAELCRAIEVPQTTINRLLSCHTNDPRISTLKAIAAFFNIRIEQILGLHPLENKKNKEVRNIPVLKWNHVKTWLNAQEALRVDNLDEQTAWVYSEQNLSDKAFALKSLPFMELHFPLNSTIIIEPKRLLQDGSFVVISLGYSDPTVRKILKDGNSILLRKPFSNDELKELTMQDTIWGTIVETRIQHVR